MRHHTPGRPRERRPSGVPQRPDGRLRSSTPRHTTWLWAAFGKLLSGRPPTASCCSRLFLRDPPVGSGPTTPWPRLRRMARSVLGEQPRRRGRVTPYSPRQVFRCIMHGGSGILFQNQEPTGPMNNGPNNNRKAHGRIREFISGGTGERHDAVTPRFFHP